MREAILGMENKVKDLRDKIDEIDLKILDLIQSRAIHASKTVSYTHLTLPTKA